MKNLNKSCIAIGNFDGIHIGHDTLIRRMIELSHETNQDSIIITFKFVKKDLRKSNYNIKYINSINNKLQLLKSYSVTDVVEIELDDVISKYSPEQFIREILVDKYNANNIVVGYNFTFGHKASGNINTLREFQDKYDYKVEEIYPVKYNGIAVSSTLVRNLLNEGKIREVTKTVTGSAHDSVMQILEKNGIAVPARCRSGECGFCHSLLKSGQVYIPKGVDGRRLADFKFGYIHPCVAFPLSDLELEVPPAK